MRRINSTTRLAEYIYARVSTTDQTTENQTPELEKVAKRNGWTLKAVFEDTISGAKTDRPALQRLLQGVIRKEFDVVMVWDVSRLERSLKHLVTLLDEFHSKGVNLYFHQQGIDTTTPSGKMMFQMCGVFAEFERSMIQERVKAGLARAKAQGKKLGRPRVPPITVRKIQALRASGLNYRALLSRQVSARAKSTQWSRKAWVSVTL
jgi:DNA invertase Pin-like site-specific DNA recombinase